jgi:hypothetical protein
MPNSIQHPRRLMAILALALVPVGAVATMTTAKQSDGSQLCEIKATPQAGVVKLEAFARGDTGAGGSYAFHVEKSGDGGRSVINQGGDLDAQAGRSQLLSSVTLDAKGTRYKAVLDLVIGGKSYSCTRQTGDD